MNSEDNFILAAIWAAHDCCRDAKKRAFYRMLMKIVWCMAWNLEEKK